MSAGETSFIPLPVPLYLLAGGRSSRFGSDKARALLHEQPLIVRCAQALAPVASEVTVVADMPGKYQDLHLPTIADRVVHQGPMGGLVAAMEDRLARQGEGWLLLAPCDLSDPRSDWVRLLAARPAGGHRAVVFRGERLEPLLGLYHTALLPVAQEHLAKQQRAMWRLITAVDHAEVPLPEGYRHLPQANTPAELATQGAASGIKRTISRVP